MFYHQRVIVELIMIQSNSNTKTTTSQLSGVFLRQFFLTNYKLAVTKPTGLLDWARRKAVKLYDRRVGTQNSPDGDIDSGE